jgi:hypothetical protein
MNFDLLNYLNHRSSCECTWSRICEICDNRFIFFMSSISTTIIKWRINLIWWLINLGRLSIILWLIVCVWLNYWFSIIWSDWNSVGRWASEWCMCFLFSVNIFRWYWGIIWFIIFIFRYLRRIYWYYWFKWRFERWNFSMINRRRKWGMWLVNGCESKRCSMIIICLMCFWFLICIHLRRRLWNKLYYLRIYYSLSFWRHWSSFWNRYLWGSNCIINNNWRLWWVNLRHGNRIRNTRRWCYLNNRFCSYWGFMRLC